MLRTLSFEGPLRPYLVRRDAFADRLKISAARAFGFDGTEEECIAFCNIIKGEGWRILIQRDEDRDEGHHPVELCTGREYLQRYGTEAHRDVFGQQFWVKAVLPDGYPSDTERDNTLLVITDVRFPNEAERVRECGGQVWKIDRPVERIAESAHASETPLSDESLIDRTIRNHGDLDALRNEVAAGRHEVTQAMTTIAVDVDNTLYDFEAAARQAFLDLAAERSDEGLFQRRLQPLDRMALDGRCLRPRSSVSRHRPRP
jgi:hypothetical protein